MTTTKGTGEKDDGDDRPDVTAEQTEPKLEVPDNDGVSGQDLKPPPSITEQQQQKLTGRQIRSRARRANRSAVAASAGIATKAPTTASSGSVVDDTVEASTKSPGDDLAVMSTNKPSITSGEPIAAATKKPAPHVSVSVAAPTPETKTPSMSIEEQDRIAKRRAVGGPGTTSAVVRPGAVSVQPADIKMAAEDTAAMEPLSLQPTSVSTNGASGAASSTSVAASASAEGPTKQLSRDEQDARAKRRARGGRATTAVVAAAATRPGAVAMKPATEREGSNDANVLTADVTVAAVEPSSPMTIQQEGKTSSSIQHPVSEREQQDRRAKARAERGRTTSTSTATARPVAVAVQPPSEPDSSADDGVNKDSASNVDAANGTKPPKQSSQREDEDRRAKDRGRRTTVMTSSTVRPGAVSVLASETHQEDQVAKASDDQNISQDLPGLAAADVVLNYVSDEPSGPLEAPSAAVSSSTSGNSQLQRDAALKSRLRTSSINSASMARPGAVAVESSDSKEPEILSGDNSQTQQDALVKSRESRVGNTAESSMRTLSSASSVVSRSQTASSDLSQAEQDAQIKARARSSNRRSGADEGQSALSSSVHSMNSSFHTSSTTSVDGSTGLDELERRREQRAAARASRRSNQDSQHGSGQTGGQSVASVSSSFAGMPEDERQRRYDMKMAEMEDGHRQSIEKRESSTNADASNTEMSSQNTARSFSNMSEDERQRRYDAKMSEMSQGHTDNLDKTGQDKTPSSQFQAPESAPLDSKDFAMPSPDMTSKDFGLEDSTRQPLISDPMAIAGRGPGGSPEVQYGEYRPNQHREVLDNELAVAVAINEDEEEAEKESLVAAHAIEYDPDSKPPIYLNRRFRLYTIGACVVFIIILIVIIVVAVTSSTSEGQTTLYLTNPPTDAPTQAPTTATESLFLDYFSGEFGLEELTPGTAEYMAADWIMYEDPSALEIDSSRLLQRYMLAFLYYHTTSLGEEEWRSCNPPKDGEDDTCTFFEFDRLPDGSEAFNEIPGRIRWLSAAPECEWNGVLCANEVVVGIRLVHQKLSGTLPTQLRALPFLQLLQFHFNDFTGTIPPEYAGFRHLLALEVHGNMLSGSIPSAFFEQDATELITLNVGDNMLTGTIDTRIGQLTDLKGLHLFRNEFEGTLPSEIGALPYLTYSRIYGNKVRIFAVVVVADAVEAQFESVALKK
mmetsp:Transcript_12958/g.31560  ORF Transcript_12958/g.31560 Transcript_12958/m.31560 type:complete len:1193 (-) Transcript_12958:654-4232(-)